MQIIIAHAPYVIAFEWPDKARSIHSGGSKGREFHAMQGLGNIEGFHVSAMDVINPSGGKDSWWTAAISTSFAKQRLTGNMGATKERVEGFVKDLTGWDTRGWTHDAYDAASVALAAFSVIFGDEWRS